MPVRSAVILLLACCSSGCLYDLAGRPLYQLPRLMPRSIEIERKAAEFHDPFPEDFGDGNAFPGRPRGFHRPRGEVRRTSELRGVHLLSPDDRLPSTSGQPEKKYRHAVKD